MWTSHFLSKSFVECQYMKFVGDARMMKFLDPHPRRLTPILKGVAHNIIHNLQFLWEVDTRITGVSSFLGQLKLTQVCWNSIIKWVGALHTCRQCQQPKRLNSQHWNSFQSTCRTLPTSAINDTCKTQKILGILLTEALTTFIIWEKLHSRIRSQFAFSRISNWRKL